MLADEIDLFISALMLERGMADNTCAAYANDLRFFAAYLKTAGKTAAAQITREDIAGFLRGERDAGKVGTTRARRTAAIRMWLKCLCERHLIAENPAELMDPPKRARALPRVLGEPEVFAMLDAVKGDDPRSLRDRALLETMYGCGLRVSEACELTLGDIIGEGELLRIFGKGSKERVVPLGRAAGEAITRYLETGRGALARGNQTVQALFLTRLGRPFTRQGVFKVIRERAAAVGIAADRISPHVLRHCYASHMLAHGADIRIIQELLGHADVGTTQIYTHVDQRRFGDIHRKCHPRA